MVVRNIVVLLNHRKGEEARKTTQERVADRVTRFTGTMFFVYLHLVMFGTWIIWNLGWLGLKAFDPSFVVLAIFASVELFFFPLCIDQPEPDNIQADKRSELDLQVSLLTEHEITKLVTLVTAMAKRWDWKMQMTKKFLS